MGGKAKNVKKEKQDFESMKINIHIKIVILTKLLQRCNMTDLQNQNQISFPINNWIGIIQIISINLTLYLLIKHWVTNFEQKLII